MKTIIRSALAAALLGFTVNASAELSDVPSGEYGLDKTHAYITFTYSHLGFSTPHVGFDSFDVDLDLDSENVENSSLDVVIDATSISSRVEEFDGHLNGEDHFDTANYPQITFASTEIRKTGDSTLDVVGDLTIKGITKPVTLKATVNKAAMHPMNKVPTVGVSAEAKVKRSEWGLAYAVPMVSDEVTIHIEVEMPQKQM